MCSYFRTLIRIHQFLSCPEMSFYDCVTTWSRSCFDGLVNIYTSPSVGGCRQVMQKKDSGLNSVDGRICTYKLFVLLAFACVFFLSYGEIDTVQCKDPVIVNEKCAGICKVSEPAI